MSPAIGLVLDADISRHVERGQLTRQGAMAAWHVVADAPHGARVRLNIGALRYYSPGLVHALVDAGALQLAAIEITGTDPSGIAATHRGLHLAMAAIPAARA